MAILTSIVAVLGGAVTTVSSLTSEGWTRYILLVGSVLLSDAIGGFTGKYLLEGLIETIIKTLTGIDLVFPVYSGISALLIIVVIMPFVIYLFRDAVL